MISFITTLRVVFVVRACVRSSNWTWPVCILLPFGLLQRNKKEMNHA